METDRCALCLLSIDLDDSNVCAFCNETYCDQCLDCICIGCGCCSLCEQGKAIFYNGKLCNSCLGRASD